jgi:hypothetical protein
MTRPALMTFCFFLLILNGFLQAFVGIGHFALLSNFAVYTGFGYLFLSLLSFATAYAVWTFQNWASRSLIAVALIMIGLSMASLIEIAGFSVLSFFVPTGC